MNPASRLQLYRLAKAAGITVRNPETQTKKQYALIELRNNAKDIETSITRIERECEMIRACLRVMEKSERELTGKTQAGK